MSAAPLVKVAGRSAPLTRRTVERTAAAVLAAEGRTAVLSITFLGRAAMEDLNRRWTGRPGPTDVLAFALREPGGGLVGDVYICSWVARREAAERGIPVRQELKRLIVHGVLHVLGYDHPEGPDRVRSAMWRRQERLVRRIR